MSTSLPSSHLFHLMASSRRKKLPYGERLDVTADELPLLQGMGLSLLELAPRGVREPHWHPNAHELSYCLEGRGLMTIFGAANQHESMILEAGTLAMVPMGYLHHIENIGEAPLKLLICFDHERFDELNLSTSMAVMPDHIMAATFRQPSTFFSSLPKDAVPVFIAEKQEVANPPVSLTTNRYKFDLEGAKPSVLTAGGWVKMSNHFSFPELQGLTVYSVLLYPGGAREPHWHPNAHELNVLVRGHARISILSPGGDLDTFDMQAGDISFLPRSYFHYIENLGQEDAHFVIFFNATAPSDIGISGSCGAYSDEVLASLFGVEASRFAPLPKYQYDLLVIKGGG